jgi:fumarate hydratase, class II
MNANEVISNRANEILGKPLGSKSPVHPNDHVNRSGSSNDGMATVMHIATVLDVEDLLIPALKSLHALLLRKTEEFQGIIKIGRTHLQDAVPLSLSQEFSGFAAQLELGLDRITHALEACRFLPMGGTATGTGLNVYKGFDIAFATAVSESTGKQFYVARNKFEAISANDAMVHISGALNTLACSLFKIAQDIRFEGSGPRCGLGELILPENEPGSSFMPGKVNPTQCEMLTMVCAKVIGNHSAVTIGGMSGQFQLNAFKPLIVESVLHSVRILSDAMNTFGERCLKDLRVDEQRVSELRDRSLMLVTCLAGRLGYDLAGKVAKNAHRKGTTLKESALELDVLSAAEFDELVRPELMIEPYELGQTKP